MPKHIKSANMLVITHLGDYLAPEWPAFYFEYKQKVYMTALSGKLFLNNHDPVDWTINSWNILLHEGEPFCRMAFRRNYQQNKYVQNHIAKLNKECNRRFNALIDQFIIYHLVQHGPDKNVTTLDEYIDAVQTNKYKDKDAEAVLNELKRNHLHDKSNV